MASALDIIEAVRPPRAVFLDYPLGHTTGKPNEPDLQREILVEALDAFTTMTKPGSVKTLPFRWSGDDTWKQVIRTSDVRAARSDAPQYQTEEDRRRAEETRPDAEPAT